MTEDVNKLGDYFERSLKNTTKSNVRELFKRLSIDCSPIKQCFLTGIRMSCLRRGFYRGWYKGTTIVTLWSHSMSFLSITIKALHVKSTIPSLSIR